MKYRIAILSRPTRSDLDDINALLPQIAERPHFLSMAELAKIVAQENVRLVVARAKIGRRSGIVGMATVALDRIPTGLVAVVEDVVVDERFRGMGIGRRLTEELIRIASRAKAKHVSLYTNPKRTAANVLYQNMGFFKKQTNHYRMNLRLPKPANAREVKALRARREFLEYGKR